MKLSNFTLGSLLCACCIGTGVLSCVATSLLVPARAPEVTVARANTSDRVDGYLTCTGYVDANLEAFYLLDSSTGLLSAAVLSKNSSSQSFQAKYQGNVNVDLEKAITILNAKGGAGKKAPSSSSSSRSRKNKKNVVAQSVSMMLPSEPKYVMTSGVHDMPGTGATRPGVSALYVTEVNTGLTLVYVLPWNSSAHSSNVPVTSPLTYYAIDRFLIPMVTEESVEEE